MMVNSGKLLNWHLLKTEGQLAPDRNEVNKYTLTIILLGVFPGFMGVVWMGMRTFITIDAIFHIIIISGAISFLAHLPFLKRLNRYLIESVFFCLIGWGNIWAAIFLLTNYFAHGKVETKYYHFQDNKSITLTLMPRPVDVEINDSLLKDFSYMRSFDDDEIIPANTASEAWYTVADGLLGYKILLHKELH